jgi:hypothetical protein
LQALQKFEKKMAAQSITSLWETPVTKCVAQNVTQPPRVVNWAKLRLRLASGDIPASPFEECLSQDALAAHEELNSKKLSGSSDPKRFKIDISSKVENYFEQPRAQSSDTFSCHADSNDPHGHKLEYQEFDYYPDEPELPDDSHGAEDRVREKKGDSPIADSGEVEANDAFQIADCEEAETEDESSVSSDKFGIEEGPVVHDGGSPSFEISEEASVSSHESSEEYILIDETPPSDETGPLFEASVSRITNSASSSIGCSVEK